MITLPPAWRAEISSVPVAGLPAATRSSGAFEAVVERVAHEVHERVAERVDHGAVELGVLADELQLDLLAELGREVAHEPREAQEHGFHGDHPDLHDHRLQRVRGAREVLHGLREARHVGLLDERLDLRAVQDELAHEVHELVQPLRVDADGGRAAVLVAAGLLLGGRRGLLGGGGAAGAGAGAGASPAGTSTASASTGGAGGAVTASSTSSGASSAASDAASKTCTSATSGTEATASWISVSVRSETTQASMSRPSNVSTASGDGTHLSVSP